MSVQDEQPVSIRDVRDIFDNDFVMESVFDHLGTDELFTCAEVNRLWQSVALSQLRKRLISVSICCSSEPEQPVQEPAPAPHSCVDVLCSKFARYRNIARLAGMRPSMVFLSYHADLNEDRQMVDGLRELLPGDSIILYFKLEVVQSADDSEDNTHEGVFGEFLFHAEPVVRPEASQDDEEPPPEGPLPGPSSSRQGEAQERPTESELTPAPPVPPVLAAATAAVSVVAEQSIAAEAPVVAEELVVVEEPAAADAPIAEPPPAAPPVVWPRPPVPSRGRGSGAVFHNVLPGVLMFQSLHVTEGTLEADVANSRFTEEATGRAIKVTSVAIFNALQSSRLEPFMSSLKESFGPTTDTIAVAFPRNQDEARLELEAFEHCFPRVPALANQATEFNVEGQFAPIGRLKMILLLIKLLEAV